MACFAECRCTKWEVVYYYDDFPDVHKRIVFDREDKLSIHLNDPRITIVSCKIFYKYPENEVKKSVQTSPRSLRELSDVQCQSIDVVCCPILPLFY